MGWNMQEAWNARAREDPVFYVESYHSTDHQGFFTRGEERAALFLDPVLSRVFGDSSGIHGLEIGCGLGRFSRALARRLRHVTATDVSDEMIAKAKVANADWDTIRFLATDGEHIPLPADSVDFAFSYEVFQHMPSHSVIRANLREVARVLKPDGAAMIHLRTGGLRVRMLYRLANLVPSWIHALIKRAKGKRALTSDATWRGAPPLSWPQIVRMARDAGLTPREFIPDPTHGPGTRVFALLSPA